jgi:hypothetical protein
MNFYLDPHENVKNLETTHNHSFINFPMKKSFLSMVYTGTWQQFLIENILNILDFEASIINNGVANSQSTYFSVDF